MEIWVPDFTISMFILETENEGGGFSPPPLHLQNMGDFQNIGGTSLEHESTAYST